MVDTTTRWGRYGTRQQLTAADVLKQMLAPSMRDSELSSLAGAFRRSKRAVIDPAETPMPILGDQEVQQEVDTRASSAAAEVRLAGGDQRRAAFCGLGRQRSRCRHTAAARIRKRA